MVSRLAVGDTSVKPEVNEFQPPRTVVNAAAIKGRVSDDLPFDSLGGMSFDYHFPLDGEYVFKIKLPLSAFGEGTPPESNAFEVRVPVKAGTRTVGVTFLAESAAVENVALPGRRGAPAPPAAPQLMAKMDLRLDGARVKLYEVPQAAGGPRFTSVSIGGPYNVKGLGDTPSRRKIFVCTPASAKDEEPCARKILSNLGRYAYRRPFTDADLKPLLAFYQTGRRRAPLTMESGWLFAPYWWRRHSCSVSSAPHRTASPAPPTRSAILNWHPGCRSSCGAASRMTSF